MKVIAIAAVGKNGVIGKGSELPWNIPEDMKFFREATKNQIVIMGRKTLDSLGKPLPKRENAIVTRNPELKVSGALVFSDVKAAIDHYLAKKNEYRDQNIFIIGGAQIYEASIPYLDEVWLTEIDQEFEGDIYFPFYKAGKFERPEFTLAQSRLKQDLASPFQYRFCEFHRKM
jgi:dihydrofolate reductase